MGSKKSKKRRYEILGERWREENSREQALRPGSPDNIGEPEAEVVIGEQGLIELLPHSTDFFCLPYH